MLSKAQSKYIRSLTRQKIRYQERAFLAEGDKIAREWLAGNEQVQLIAATGEWLKEHAALTSLHPEAKVAEVTNEELAEISQLQTPNGVLLAVSMPSLRPVPQEDCWYLALDDLQDPGNMGTIIRIADWFGIRHVICSPGCVDVYNPKVVQSAMGGHLRVGLYEHDLPDFLEQTKLTKYAATLHGANIYNESRSDKGVLIIGNESKGISDAVLKHVNRQVTIPARGGAESLNASVATGIICALLMQQ